MSNSNKYMTFENAGRCITKYIYGGKKQDFV